MPAADNDSADIGAPARSQGPGTRRGQSRPRPWESAWTPGRIDAVITLLAIFVGVGDSWVKRSNGLLTGASITWVAAVSATAGLLLAWRRRYPDAVAGAVIACHVLTFTPFALAVALFTVGAAHHRRPRILFAYAAIGCVADAVGLLGGHAWDTREAGYTLALAIGPLAAGYAVALRRDLADAAHTELQRAERENTLLIARAREEERTRIARDMHDVVAHRVGHMVLVAGSLRVSTPANPHQVAERSEQIRSEGRKALEELREVLGVLTPGRTRRHEPRTGPRAAPSLTDLVASARTAGADIVLNADRPLHTLPTVVQHTLHRTVQEALTNAAKHAPGAPVRITVATTARDVELTVLNGPATKPRSLDLPSGGNGLIGLRERATLLGGEFAAAPEADQFRLRMRLPLPPPTSRTPP
ncbi:sensor histidine kinase [Streptomyces zhihengii]